MSSPSLLPKPSVLTTVTTGMLKASHRRTKRAALDSALVAQGGSLGGHDANRAAADGSQSGERCSCRSLHTAPQRCPRQSEQRCASPGSTCGVQRRGGALKSNRRGRPGCWRAAGPRCEAACLAAATASRRSRWRQRQPWRQTQQSLHLQPCRLAAEVNGAFRNSSASSAMTQTSAQAAFRALVPPQARR